jgi:hypothetical protein
MPTELNDGVLPSQPTTELLVNRLRSPDSGWSGDALAVDCSIAEEAASRIEDLKKALQPLAKIGLWRDLYPDAKNDTLMDRRLVGIVSVADVRAARAVLQPKGAAV